MPNINPRFALSAIAVAASLLVAACGGGGASPPNTVAGSSGFAVDDYLIGSAVLCDSNGNGQSDAGESSTTTDSTGFFNFASACSATIVVTGGTNLDTGLPFTGKLQAPPGATFVTPLTTLISAGMTKDQINTALGLPSGTDVRTLDPARKVGGVLVNPDLFRKTLAVQQLIQKTAETLANVAGAGASGVLPTIYSEVAASVANSLRSNPVLLSGGTMDQAAVTTLVQAATLRVQTSSALSTEIKAGLAVNAESLAQVMAGAVVTQANAILQATDAASITAITRTVQGDTTIASFALQNKTTLAAAPSSTTTNLAATLVQQVPGGITPPPPPPPVNGTVLISWDEATSPATNIGAFGDAGPSVATAPAGGSGNALKLDRTGSIDGATGAPFTYGGTYFDVPAVPFAADRKTITARVYATRANAVVYLKVEVPGGTATELPATVTAANTWQTLTWVLDGVNPANNYTVMVFSADTNVSNLGAQTYWIDDVALASAPVSTGCATSTEQCISFSESTVGANPFELLNSAQVANDPDDAANPVLKMVKGPASQPWAGATVYTMGDPTVNPDALSIDAVGLATSKVVTLKSYSGAAVGTKISLKLENVIDPTKFAFAEAVTTVQNGWETLTFNFANLTLGAYGAAVTYNKASIFPAWSEVGGTQPALSSDTTFYFDELKYAVAVSAPPPPPPPPPSGNDTVVADFDTVVPVVRGPEHGGTGFIATTDIPAGGGTGAVLGVLRSGGQTYALNVLEATFQFAADRKTLSAKVYSPTAGIRMVMKVEGSAGGIELDANETVVVGWQTLTWTYSAASTSAGAYNLLVILPNFGVVDAAPGKTYYFDDIKVLAAAGGGGGGATTPGVDLGSGGPQTLTTAAGNVTTGDGGNTMFVAGEGLFAVNYVGSAEPTPPNNLAAWPNAKTANFGTITGISGGDIGYFQDDVNLSNSSQKVDEGGWVAGTAIAPLGVPNFFRYFVLKGPVSNAAYMGTYVNAPNNGTVNVSSFSKLKVKVWGPAPMFERTNFDPVLEVTLTGPKVAGCTTGSGGSEVTQNLTANLKNGAGGFYTMPLSGFTVKGLCGSDLGAADVLAKLARVVVTVPGTSFNYTNIDGGNYTTGVNLGPVGFTNN
ncbi:MAG: hypothetical protein QUV35_02405 [Hydrogenophaga sp.]|uniref:hypothetical protein n=1 Tax=Hydrogenophaga sp. TaxID=1904254 RepID=UPI00260CBD48|nr:hypothetical protein [Hydrogenophaga sp.]MDM7941459.1 hypothetical protein [Hydrogenophaga sp.]